MPVVPEVKCIYLSARECPQWDIQMLDKRRRPCGLQWPLQAGFDEHVAVLQIIERERVKDDAPSLFMDNNTINVKPGRMTDMTHCIGGSASITSTVCWAHVGNVDMADDIVMDGHILAHDVPEKR